MNEFNIIRSKIAQIGGTCYAHACSDVICAVELRIYGRNPDKYKIRKDIINQFGSTGANTEAVLAEFCPPRQIQWKVLSDQTQVMEAIQKLRPVIVSFRLTGAQWKSFSSFFKKDPSGTL